MKGGLYCLLWRLHFQPPFYCGELCFREKTSFCFVLSLGGKEVGSRVGGLAVHFLTLLARPPWAEFLSAGVLGGLRVGLSRERFFVSQGTLFAFRLKSPVLSKRDLTVFVFFAVFGGSGQRDACARI